jgi:single-stranded DNA-binding protein
MINKVTLIGNLGKEPEIKTTTRIKQDIWHVLQV